MRRLAKNLRIGSTHECTRRVDECLRLTANRQAGNSEGAVTLLEANVVVEACNSFTSRYYGGNCPLVVIDVG